MALDHLLRSGPVGFLVRRAADRLAAARRFHRALGIALDAAAAAALDDLPRLHIQRTTTDKRVEEVVRLAELLRAAASEAKESIAGAHLEADLVFRAEMALAREERR